MFPLSSTSHGIFSPLFSSLPQGKSGSSVFSLFCEFPSIPSLANLSSSSLLNFVSSTVSVSSTALLLLSSIIEPFPAFNPADAISELATFCKESGSSIFLSCFSSEVNSASIFSEAQVSFAASAVLEEVISLPLSDDKLFGKEELSSDFTPGFSSVVSFMDASLIMDDSSSVISSACVEFSVPVSGFVGAFLFWRLFFLVFLCFLDINCSNAISNNNFAGFRINYTWPVLIYSLLK